MNESSAPRLEAAIRTTLAPLLREDGFSGSGRTFRRIKDGWVQVVNVQGSRYGSSFAINLAVHPLAIPDLNGDVPNPKKITEELCEFRRRLSEKEGDQWWKHEPTSESMASAMAEAAEAYMKFGRPLFERVSGASSPMMTVTPAEFCAESYDFAGFASTKVRMALALSRLRKCEGRPEDSKAFAAYGLENVGAAASLRRELHALLAQQ